MSYEDSQADLNIQRIKEMLPEFIMEHGEQVTVSSNGQIMCCCLNPEHPDKSPSMGVHPERPWLAHCFGCQANYNIFHLNNIINGAPLSGMEFIEKNVNMLALHFGVEPIDIGTMSETYKAKVKIYSIIDSAFTLLSSGSTGSNLITYSYAEQNGLLESTSRNYGVGTVLDYRKFKNTIMKQCNCTETDLISALGMEWMALFGPKKITYTIFNNKGQPCSFACRNLDYDGKFGIAKSTRKGPKWLNGATTLVYDKDNILYGLYQVKKSKQSIVYMFEGQTDVLVAHQNGLTNAFCKGGTGTLKPKDVQLLKDMGIDTVVIALDNDFAGRRATDSTLREAFTEITGVKPRVLEVPRTPKTDGSDGYEVDPDNYIITFGAESFTSLPTMTAFGYMVKRAKETVDEKGNAIDFEDAERKTQFLDRFMPIIMQEPSRITQEQMRKDIAQVLNVSPSLIRENQEALESRANTETTNTIRKFFSRYTREFYDTIDLSPTTIVEKGEELFNFIKSQANPQNNAAMAPQEQLEAFTDFFHDLQNADLSGQFWKTGLPLWDAKIGGVKKSGNFTAILAPQNIGKSNVLMNLTLGICQNNNPEEFLILYWTIDDPRKDLFTKLLCILSGVEIQDMSDYKNLNPDVRNRIIAAKDKLEKWMRNDRCLSIKDQAIGVSASDLTRWIQYEQDKQPEKKVILFIDNFANMDSSAGDELQNQIKNINKLHSFRVMNDMAIIAAMELNKESSTGRTSSKGISGSQKIIYRLTMALAVSNELDDRKNQNNNPDSTKVFWTDSSGNVRPVLQIDILKLKMTTKKYWRRPWLGRLHNTTFKIDEIGTKDDYDRFIQEQAQDKHTGTDWTFRSSSAPHEISANVDPFASIGLQNIPFPKEQLVEDKSNLTLIKGDQNTEESTTATSAF